jgi:hypothetical protein
VPARSCAASYREGRVPAIAKAGRVAFIRLAGGAAFGRLATAIVLVSCAPALAWADMPNGSLTPGAVAETNSRVVCAFRYASSHRKVPYAERDAVYREYGIPRGTRYASPRRGYRIDHLIPLELGGANTMRNLWPQRYADSKVKDRVEDALHQAVCLEHTVTLQEAQTAIARDWRRTPVGLPSR